MKQLFLTSVFPVQSRKLTRSWEKPGEHCKKKKKNQKNTPMKTVCTSSGNQLLKALIPCRAWCGCCCCCCCGHWRFTDGLVLDPQPALQDRSTFHSPGQRDKRRQQTPVTSLKYGSAYKLPAGLSPSPPLHFTSLHFTLFQFLTAKVEQDLTYYGYDIIFLAHLFEACTRSSLLNLFTHYQAAKKCVLSGSNSHVTLPQHVSGKELYYFNFFYKE